MPKLRQKTNWHHRRCWSLVPSKQRYPALAPNMKMPPELGSAASEAEPLAPPKMLPELLGAESKMLAAGFASSPSEAGFAALKRPSVSV